METLFGVHAQVSFSLHCSMLLSDPNLLRFLTQDDPILDPMLAPINPSFAVLFPIAFPIRFPTLFWTDFGPQIDFKINQKWQAGVRRITANTRRTNSWIFNKRPRNVSFAIGPANLSFATPVRAPQTGNKKEKSVHASTATTHG